MDKLTENEISLIIDGLNAMWHSAHDRLRSVRNLGGFEIKRLEELKIESKKLMEKIGAWE